MSRVLIHPADYETVRASVDRAFELFPMDITGRKVVVKPNVLRVSEASEGIVTHPAVLRAVVEKIESMKPASLVVGDNPGLFSYGDNENSFRKTGLMDAAKGYYRNIGNDSVKFAFNPEYMPSVSLSREIVEADIVVSLPKFKTHGLTVLTGAIKNSYGMLPGAQKAALHKAAGSPDRFHELIVEVFRLRPPDLFIVDAVVGMEGNGPASADLRDIGLILASDNAVALDAVIAYMMGCEPERLKFLRKAKEAGLGDYDLEKVEIVGELKRLSDFRLPPLGGEAILANAAIQSLMSSKAMLRPRIDRELCTACGTCVGHCAVSALAMNAEGFPEADPAACISCFCCQEMCPEKAIELV